MAAALERQRRADREPGPRPHAAAAVGAEVIERMPEVPVGAVPAKRQLGEAHLHALGELVEDSRQRADGHCFVFLEFGFCPGWHGGRPRPDRLEEKRHRDVGLAHQVSVRRRQPLVIGAPAAMDMSVDRDADHFGPDRRVAPRRLQRARGVDPVERQHHIRFFQ